MSDLTIRTAPYQRGTVAVTPAGPVGVDVQAGGGYIGELPRSATLKELSGTNPVVGTDAFVVEYEETLHPNAEKFTVAVASDYTPGDRLPLLDGVWISFGPGTWGGSGTYFLGMTMTPLRILPLDWLEIVDDGCSARIYGSNNALDSADDVFKTGDGRSIVIARGIRRSASLQIDYQGMKQTRVRQAIEQLRHTVTIGENYNESTELLIRAGNGSFGAMIGPRGTSPRTGDVASRDPRTGLYRLHAADEIPTALGFERDTYEDDGLAITRNEHPTPFAHVGQSFHAGVEGDNLLPYWRPSEDESFAPGVWRWTFGGGGTGGFIEPYDGLLDPRDSGWPEKWIRSHNEIQLQTVDTSYIQSNEATIADQGNVSAAIWVRGRGAVYVDILTGTTGSVTNLHQRQTVQLRENNWQLCVVSEGAVSTPAGHDRAVLRVMSAAPDTIVDLDIAQLIQGLQVGPLFVPTDGTPSSVGNANVATGKRIPSTGTLHMGIRNPVDGHRNTYMILRDVGNEFYLRRKALTASEQWEWYTKIGVGPLIVPGSPNNWRYMTWLVITLTWEPYSIDPTLLERKLYIDGELAGTDQTSDYVQGTWGNLVLGSTTTVGGNDAGMSFQFQEVRMDRRAMTAEEVRRAADRLLDADAHQTSIDFQGRGFRIMGESSPWRTPLHPHQVVAEYDLEEHDHHLPSLALGR